MLATPRKFTLVTGAAEGGTKLNAFDNALLAAGIGNLNLLRVSSILPPEAVYVEKLAIPFGSLVPTAYGSITSEEPGQLLCAGIGVGMAVSGYGVIMEYSAYGSKNQAEEMVAKMLQEAFQVRDLRLQRTMIKAVEHRVERIGAVFAGAALWY